ncbi:hypothetical protein WMF26_01940 [Sorangium sp. So ce185]|uniref:hypothetical protein n=1 Tax=Sorangium sp. So ce185 TaxID=3133287 RepID=UPI003F644A9E
MSSVAALAAPPAAGGNAKPGTHRLPCASWQNDARRAWSALRSAMLAAPSPTNIPVATSVDPPST